jgi:uncharacterized membrane protein
MALIRLAGIALAGTGALHFARPQLFEPMTKIAFPENTQQWIQRNGATELALGLALTSRKTRLIGLGGVAAYALWLGSRTVSASTN